MRWDEASDVLQLAGRTVNDTCYKSFAEVLLSLVDSEEREGCGLEDLTATDVSRFKPYPTAFPHLPSDAEPTTSNDSDTDAGIGQMVDVNLANSIDDDFEVLFEREPCTTCGKLPEVSQESVAKAVPLDLDEFGATRRRVFCQKHAAIVEEISRLMMSVDTADPGEAATSIAELSKSMLHSATSKVAQTWGKYCEAAADAISSGSGYAAEESDSWYTQEAKRRLREAREKQRY